MALILTAGLFVGCGREETKGNILNIESIPSESEEQAGSESGENNDITLDDEMKIDFTYDYSEDIKADVDYVVSGSVSLQKELEILQTLKTALEEGKCARAVEFEAPEDIAFVESLTLLTQKPVLYAANVSEEDLADNGAGNQYVNRVRIFADSENSEVFVLCAKIEEEISDLDKADKKEFLADMGVETSGLDRLISASYKLLGLISYLTAGVTESRAWTIKKGTKAPGAAGKIHSDFERGFIRAEVVSYDDLINIGSYNGAKEQGLVRSEGKEYVVKDGDVILFRFNV